MKTRRLIAAALLLCAFGLGLGCRAIDSPEELQTLAGDAPQEAAVVEAEATASPAAGADPGGDESLDDFPLVGSVFPGLRSGLHSSLCDPAADPYGTCI